MQRKVYEIIDTLKDLQEVIRREFKAEVIGIFGSYVRGEEKEGSDVDIL